MRSHIQFLTTPTVDTPGTALILCFDDKRYIIGNIHEGLQRAAIQRGVKLLKVSDIFLTGKTEWSTNGGLLGVILTLADSVRTSSDAAIAFKASRDRARLSRHPPSNAANQTTPNEIQSPGSENHTLTVHGGPNVTHTIATARRYAFRKGMPVDINEIRVSREEQNWEPTWADGNIRVWAMSTNPSSSEGLSLSENTPSPRKRSFDEFQENLAGGIVAHKESSTEDQDQEIRRNIVGHMFDSGWRLDHLVEIPIAQVKMPAALFVRNQSTNKIEKYTGPLPGGNSPLPDIKVLTRKPWPGALIPQLPPTKPSTTIISYIVRNHPQRGKFLPDKAIALNVEKGYKFRELTKGISVTSKDGKTVLPEQVLAPGKPGGGFAVIELPSRDYVCELINRPEWRATEVMEGVEVFIWILGHGVGEDQNLIKFMDEFKNHKHFVSSKDHCPNMLSMDSAAAGAIRLNQIDPIRYPIPIHNNVPTIAMEDFDDPHHSTSRFSIASRGLKIQLEPSVAVQEENIEHPLNTAVVIRETPADVLLLAKSVKNEIASVEFQKSIEKQDLPSPDAEIICLGTGSALPSKYRNVSATLLRVPGSGSYLLDCGENTLGQLSRVYGPEELLEVLRDLKMIWISHAHADHHLGTVSVIKAWYQAVYGKDDRNQPEQNMTFAEGLLYPAKVLNEQRRLFIASDGSILSSLEEYASVEDYGFHKTVPLKVFAAKPGKPDTTGLAWNKTNLFFKSPSPLKDDLSAALRAATGLTNLAVASVSHCFGAKAVSLTFPTGFKFSYSGDCRPSRSFTEIGMDSTVLLHEATFDDELRGDAQAKLHCTTSEAIGVGIAMGARRILLTHFSQRYQKIPIMDGVAGQNVTFEDETDELDPMAGMDAESTPVDAESTPVDTKSTPTDVDVSLSGMVENDAALDDLLNLQPPTSPCSKDSKQGIHKVSMISKGPPQDMKVGVAFDYMRVKVKDMAVLERFTPVLLKLYEDEHDKLVRKNDKRSSSEEVDASTENSTVEKEEKQQQKQKKQRKKMGNGKMGRVQMSEQQKLDMRSGKELFDERDKQKV